MARAQAGLRTDEELELFVGDDFRRVFAKYAGPPEFSPDAAFSRSDVTSRTPFGVERTGYGYGQPISHPLAATMMELELARSLALFAAWCIAEGDERGPLAAVAAKFGLQIPAQGTLSAKYV